MSTVPFLPSSNEIETLLEKYNIAFNYPLEIGDDILTMNDNDIIYGLKTRLKHIKTEMKEIIILKRVLKKNKRKIEDNELNEEVYNRLENELYICRDKAMTKLIEETIDDEDDASMYVRKGVSLGLSNEFCKNMFNLMKEITDNGKKSLLFKGCIILMYRRIKR